MDATLQKQLEQSRYIRRPMELIDPQNGAYDRWLKKPAVKSRSIDLYREFDQLVQEGPGLFTPCPDFTRNGRGSVRLDTPTSTAVKNPTNRRYAYSGFFYPLPNEDLAEYNRLSLWVYVDAPGLNFDSVTLELHNRGEHVIPVPGRFEGSHHTEVKTGSWTQLIWEIPDLYRDRVIGIKVYCSLHGTPVNTSPRKTLYFEDLRIETVENPEKSRGFSLVKDSIAYCHSGYRQDARKQALIQNADAKEFSLLDDSGKEVFSGPVTPRPDGFGLLDFSPFTAPGTYTIRAGALCSNPFPIGPQAYESAAWKALSFFFSERCGFEVPGVHIECHLDAVCRHPDGRTVPIWGGWHDAADVSQSIDKTCDVILAMLDLADATGQTDPILSGRVLEEARWGLNWAMRTRFGDGYRHTSLVKGIWTANFRGDKDDMTGEAQNTAIHNYTASYTCACAVPFFAEDPSFSNWCLQCAREDFAFAQERLESSEDNSLMAERIALAVASAAMLYRITHEPAYLDAAALRARQLSQCQQLERMEELAPPLHGFFYEDRQKTRPISFYHRSYEHFFLKGFLLLLADAPDHPDAPLWRRCVDAYADYIRETADAMAPWSILPAGVYELNNTDYSKMSHEGNRDTGAPTLAEYNAQVQNGIHLGGNWYLRRFPVAYQFRGFFTTLLSKAKNVFHLARFYEDRSLYDLAVRQLEYVLGFNPFAMSTMYGEGYDYPPLYGALAGQPVGAVPVGFETFENDDEPYMPMQNNCTYKEIWVCSTARVMWSIAEVYRGL